MVYELKKAGLKTFRQVKIPFQYDGQILDLSLCLDVLIQDEIIIELKAVKNMIPLYKAQLISYLKLTNKRLGYLINFNVPVFKNFFLNLFSALSIDSPSFTGITNIFD